MPVNAEEAVDVFKMFDKNRDDSVDKEEFFAIVRALGDAPTLVDLQAMFDKSSSGGQLSLTSFKGDVVPKLTGGTFSAAQMVEMFKVFDRDGNGKVSANEIRSVTAGVFGEPLSSSEIDEILKLAKVDADGQIDYNAFVNDVLSA